jgi:tetratricopeptide (TPR) repeat protein
MRWLVGAVQLVQAPHQAAQRPAALGIALLLAALLPAALLGACATRPPDGLPHPEDVPTEPPVGPKPSPYGYREDAGYARSAEEVSGPAVINLLNRARSDLSAGRVEQAVASLETALQIEKRNPFVWQQLARAHLQRHAPEDAEIVAQRSNGFARGNPYIEIENWRLIGQARNALGDRAGAEQARAKVTELQDRIGDD